MSNLSTNTIDKFLSTCFDSLTDVTFAPMTPANYPTNLEDLAVLINCRICKIESALIVKELKTRKELVALRKNRG